MLILNWAPPSNLFSWLFDQLIERVNQPLQVNVNDLKTQTGNQIYLLGWVILCK